MVKNTVKGVTRSPLVAFTPGVGRCRRSIA